MLIQDSAKQARKGKAAESKENNTDYHTPSGSVHRQ